MKKTVIIILAFVSIFQTNLKAQSDGCSAATAIPITATCSSPVSGTTTGATQTIAGCVGTADDDVWYVFTATATSHLITVTPSASMDPVVQLFSGPCSSLISITCMDNGMTGDAETIFASGLTIGTTYTVRIYHYYTGAGSGNFTICITNAPTAPSNDNCTSATLLTVSTSCSYTNATTVSATQSQAGCAGTADDDVWFRFVATNSVQTITVDPSSNMDPVVELFSGTCTGLSSITCMDVGFTDGNEVISAVGLIPGNTYYVRVYDYYTGTGGAPFQICITGAATSAPTNDEPCNSIALPAVTSACNFLSFTTVGATTSTTAPTPTSCVGGSAPQQGGFSNTPQPKDVWFSITVPSSGIITITAQPGYGISDGVMALYSGTSCSSLTQIACSDDNAGYPGTSNDLKPFIMASGLTPGNTVYLRYWAYSGNTTGVFGICVSTPTNDNCGGSLYICDLNGYTGTTSAAYTIDRPCNMRGNAETNNPPTYTYTPGVCQGGIFGLGGAWGTGAPSCDVQINNNSWIRFTAAGPTATLNVNINNCFIGNYPSGGIQMQIFAANGACCDFTPVSDFKEGSSLLTITANGLTMGSDYYLMIDGFAGDVCSYSITATSGVQFPDITTASSSICAGQTITLYGPAGASGYLWSPGGQTTQNITVTPAYSQTYSLEVTGVCGYRQTMDIAITVNNLPTPIASSNSPVCSGNTINLSSSGGSSYSWSGPGGYTSTAQNPSRTSSTTAMTGTYTVTVTSSAGCKAVASTNVTVNSSPTATVSNTGPYCAGSTIQLDASGGTSYSWTGPSSFSSSAQNPSRTGSTTAMAGTYNVTVTNASNCTATGSTNVTVNATPSALASNTGAYCAGNTIQLNASGGTSYAWSGPSGWTSSSQNPTRTNATSGMTGTYYVTVTGAGSCTAVASTSVTVNDNPSITASNTGPYCAGSTINLNVSGGNSYYWSGPSSWNSSIQSPSLSNATTAMSGNYNVTVTASNNCTSTTSTTVTVNSNPIADAGTSISITNGASTTLTGSATGGSGNYGYLWSPSSSLLNATLQNPTTTNLTITTVYSVTVTDQNSGCTGTDQVTITITGGPFSSSLTANPTTICQGQTSQLNAMASGGSGSYTYVWSSNPTGFTSSIYNPIVNPTITTTYYVTVTDGVSTSTGNVTVNVNPSPSAIVSNTGPYCEGATIQLNSSGGTDYAWTGPDGWVSTNQNPSRTTAATSMSGQYYVTITNASNCTTIGTTSVTVNANPIATSSNTGPYCAGATIELSSGTGSSYSWSGPGGWSSSQQDPDITASTPSMAGVYNVIITGANSCTASSSTTVTIYNNPIVDAGNNTSITFGTYTNLSASVTGGSGNYSYEWSPASSLINSNIQNPQTVNLTVTTTFTVTVTDITTGCATTDNVTISISGTALVLDVSSNMLTICQGETAILNAATTGGTGSYTYLWASSPSGFSASTPSPTVSPTATTTYLVTVSDGFNSANGQVTISVNPIPTAICSNAGIYCAGDIISLIASGGSNYLWSGPAAFTSSLQNPAIANAQTLMNGIYYVTVSNVFGCVDTASTEVVVHPLPIMVVSNNGPFCPGDTIQLFAEGGNVYSWTGPAAFSSTDQNPVIYTANASQTGTYEVIVTSTEGCTSYGQTDISYSDPMTVTSIVETDQASHQGIINITVTGGVNPYTYIWSNGNTTEDINGLFSGTYTITINDALQCAHVESFEINIPLIIPNVITPNNDGKNDDFEILNIGAYSEVSIKVFSRWTEEIFSFKGTGLEYYQTENRWNGTLNGNKLPMGSYLYIVIIDDHEPLTGSVLLKY